MCYSFWDGQLDIIRMVSIRNAVQVSTCICMFLDPVAPTDGIYWHIYLLLPFLDDLQQKITARLFYHIGRTSYRRIFAIIVDPEKG